MAAKKLSRRDLFRFLGHRVEQVAGRTAAAARPTGGLVHLRPPGFRDQGTEACRECRACAEACPRDAIFSLPGASAADPAPRIDPAVAPCVLCDDLPCIPACPAGVLLPVGRSEVRMAVAEIIEGRCRHFDEKPCLDCYRACPLPGVAMRYELVAWGVKPQVIAEGCTGCGNCLHACPERPRAMRMLPPRPVE